MKLKEATLYDSTIGINYKNALTNLPHKNYIEGPTFFKCLGDIAGKTLLDLACGDGYYSRQMNERGASRVVGVDISPAMIEEAKKYEDYKEAGSLIYEVGNAKTYESSFLFDIVTSQYLFPYASTKNDLLLMCQSAYNALKPGGTFAGVSTWLGDMNMSPDKAYWPLIGYKWHWDGTNVHDGMLVQVTLFDSEGQARVTLPNHLWSRETFANAIYDAGFAKLEWVSEECSNYENAEVKKWADAARLEFGLHGYFVARKEESNVEKGRE